jgi:hypothetical protein
VSDCAEKERGVCDSTGFDSPDRPSGCSSFGLFGALVAAEFSVVMGDGQ